MEEESTLDLREMWEIIRKRLKLIILVTLIATILSGVLSYFVLPKVYEARTSIIVGLKSSEGPDGKLQYSDIMMYQSMIKTYAEIAKQRVVAEKAATKLDGNYTSSNLLKMITITPQPNTQILTLKVNSKTPEEAKNIANTYTEAFVDEATRLYPEGSIQIMDKAILPENPVKPRPLLNTAIAFVLGLMVSIGIVFLMEYMDSTIKTEDDVEKYLDLPVIGIIPKQNEQ